jgi:hypothetical protein
MTKPQSPLTDTSGNAAAFPLALFVIFLAIGLAMLSGAGYSTLETRHDIAVGTTANGTVTDLFHGSDSDGDSVYYPRVRFVTQSGDVIEFTGSNGASPPAFEVGETVSVLYDPISPGNARINGFFQLWLLPMILGAMGSVFATIGGVGLIVCGRSKTKIGSLRRGSARPSVRAAEATQGSVVQRLSRD